MFGPHQRQIPSLLVAADRDLDFWLRDAMAKQRRYREKTAELITVLEGLLPDHRRPPQGFASACGTLPCCQGHCKFGFIWCTQLF